MPPRDLGDVLHYFEPALPAATQPSETEPQPERLVSAPLVVPLAEADLVRAALVWNLAVELGRRGVQARLSTTRGSALSSLAPPSGSLPLGAEFETLPTRDGRELVRAATAAAGSGVALRVACVPREELGAAVEAGSGRVLLLAAPGRTALREATALAEQALLADPETRVGVTVHGVRSVGEAQRAFERIAAAVEQHLGRGVVSYGLLVDDLAVYRAIVERRPVGLAHPQSPAARALGDVARLLHQDLLGSES